MKNGKLFQKRIAIVATDGFEEAELLEPRAALEKAGATVDIVSIKKGKIKAWKGSSWGKQVSVSHTFADADPDSYDGVMLPGGVMNADTIRNDKKAVGFVKRFAESGKPIAAICHAAWTLIETGYVRGHALTSWPSLRTDLENAGAEWRDEKVVVDGSWVSSRKPSDIPAFNKKMIESLAAVGREAPYATYE
ncbi:MAG: type 1 glutamine amidotransferase domain-containing protein [Bdellovibrionota bacterium]